MANGEIKTKDGAVTPANNVRLADVQCVKQRYDVIGHEIVAVGTSVARAAAMATAIYNDHGVAAGENPDLIFPPITLRSAPALQEHRRTPADRNVIEAG